MRKLVLVLLVLCALPACDEGGGSSNPGRGIQKQFDGLGMPGSACPGSYC
jgi:hypothetical protein